MFDEGVRTWSLFVRGGFAGGFAEIKCRRGVAESPKFRRSGPGECRQWKERGSVIIGNQKIGSQPQFSVAWSNSHPERKSGAWKCAVQILFNVEENVMM
jgi:hypothetical protein